MQEINKRTRKKVTSYQLYDNYDNFPSITKKVYNLMIESGLTQKEFADKIGVTQQTLCRLFRINEKNGKFPKVTANIREGMMAAFNLPKEWFVAEGEANTDGAPKGSDQKSQLARLQYVKDYLIDTGRITSILSLSDTIKVTREYISFVFNGKVEITLDFLNTLNEAFGYIFDVNWIFNGEGDMLAKKDDKSEIIKKLMDENARLKEKLQEAAMEIINLNSEIRNLKK